MKIEHLIVQHLYNSKQVTLQDIGTFILSPEIAIDHDNKDAVLPSNAVSFEFNKKAKQDEDLINFIVSQTRKIKPLATSDLESYSILAKQFLNIGKPFPIEGLGVLQKAQTGEYEFVQGNFINAKLEAAPALLKEKMEEEISFSSPPREQTSAKKWIWVLVLFIIAATGATLYYFLKKENKDKIAEPVATTDTTATLKDTVQKPGIIVPDSTVLAAPKTDSFTFKIVIKEFPDKPAAEKAFAKYKTYGHTVILYSKDSSTYKIAIPFMRPLSDTLRAKDSLRLFFNTRTYVEKD